MVSHIKLIVKLAAANLIFLKDVFKSFIGTAINTPYNISNKKGTIKYSAFDSIMLI